MVNVMKANKHDKYSMFECNQNWLQYIFSKLVIWKRNYRTRRQLAELPEYLFDDLGLDRTKIEKELRKPFWQD